MNPGARARTSHVGVSCQSTAATGRRRRKCKGTHGNVRTHTLLRTHMCTFYPSSSCCEAGSSPAPGLTSAPCCTQAMLYRQDTLHTGHAAHGTCCTRDTLHTGHAVQTGHTAHTGHAAHRTCCTLDTHPTFLCGRSQVAGRRAASRVRQRTPGMCGHLVTLGGKQGSHTAALSAAWRPPRKRSWRPPLAIGA